MEKETLKELIKDTDLKELFAEMLSEHLTVDMWTGMDFGSDKKITVEITFDDELITRCEATIF